MNRTLVAASVVLLTCGCASKGATLPDSPVQEKPLEGGWRSPLHPEHPLAGRIWDVKRGGFVEEAELVRALAGAR
ncbi:MAG TPA: hypothetical protein VE153_01280, partial [Myxococcus sp.]|nr:hypothetical protein [Myxococcus sp.]